MSQHFFPFSCQRRPCLRQFCSCCSILKNFFFYNQTYYKYMLFHTDIKISWVIYMGVFSSVQFSSVAQSCPWTAAHQLPCPSRTPRVCWNPYPLSQWCHPTISSSVIPFSSCLQYFPASGSFPTIQFFTSDGQSIGVSGSWCVYMGVYTHVKLFICLHVCVLLCLTLCNPMDYSQPGSYVLEIFQARILE